MRAYLAAALLLALLAPLSAKLVTIRNDVPRLDMNGDIIDCHSGNIVAVNGLYYMYGEHYGNSSGMGPSPPQMFPKIVVYTVSSAAPTALPGLSVQPARVRRLTPWQRPWAARTTCPGSSAEP